jgi:hypothetical protein
MRNEEAHEALARLACPAHPAADHNCARCNDHATVSAALDVVHMTAVAVLGQRLLSEAHRARAWHGASVRPAMAPRIPPSLAIAIVREAGRIEEQARDEQRVRPCAGELRLALFEGEWTAGRVTADGITVIGDSNEWPRCMVDEWGPEIVPPTKPPEPAFEGEFGDGGTA